MHRKTSTFPYFQNFAKPEHPVKSLHINMLAHHQNKTNIQTKKNVQKKEPLSPNS